MIRQLLIYLTGFIICLLLAIFRRKKYDYNLWQSIVITFIGLFSVIFGAILLYNIENIRILLKHQKIQIAFSLFGCIILYSILIPLCGKLLKKDFKKTMDLMTPVLIIGLLFARLNCWFNGCCHGIDILWLNNEYYRIPVQLIECGLQLICFTIFIILEKKNKNTGYFYPMYLVMYGFIRFILEFVRFTPKNILGMSNGQIFALIAIIIGGLILILNANKIREINHPTQPRVMINNTKENTYTVVSKNYKRGKK